MTATTQPAPISGDQTEASPTTFLHAMANVCAPVTVITTVTGAGQPYATTVSAFASLSLDPPMVTVALGRDSVLLGHAVEHRRIGVNVLAQDQADLALRFARSRDDDFTDLGWTTDQQLPRLDGGVVWLACTVDTVVPGGDHVVLLAHVDHADTVEQAPLVYARRTFGTHSAIGPGAGTPDPHDRKDT